MIYHTNELKLDLPPELKDKSVHVFSLTDDGPSEFSLVITRTPLPTGDDLAGYVTRQLKQMMENLPGFKLLQQSEAKIDGRSARQTDYSWQADDGSMYQRQVAVITARTDQGGDQVVMLTATCLSAFAEKWSQVFEHILSSVQIAV